MQVYLAAQGESGSAEKSVLAYSSQSSAPPEGGGLWIVKARAVPAEIERFWGWGRSTDPLHVA